MADPTCLVASRDGAGGSAQPWRPPQAPTLVAGHGASRWGCAGLGAKQPLCLCVPVKKGLDGENEAGMNSEPSSEVGLLAIWPPLGFVLGCVAPRFAAAGEPRPGQRVPPASPSPTASPVPWVPPQRRAQRVLGASPLPVRKRRRRRRMGKSPRLPQSGGCSGRQPAAGEGLTRLSPQPRPPSRERRGLGFHFK